MCFFKNNNGQIIKRGTGDWRAPINVRAKEYILSVEPIKCPVKKKRPESKKSNAYDKVYHFAKSADLKNDFRTNRPKNRKKRVYIIVKTHFNFTNADTE